MLDVNQNSTAGAGRWYTRPPIAGMAIIATIVSVPLALYFGWASSRSRELSWYASAPRPLVQRGQAPTPLEVRFSGRPIDHDVYVLQVQLWNAGRLEIEETDVLSPIVLQIKDGARPAEILDAKVLSTSRPETRFVLAPRSPSSQGQVPLSWRILELHDGGLIQLVCATEAVPSATVAGSVKGQHRVLAVRATSQSRFPSVLFVIFCVFVPVISMSFIESLVKRTSWRSTVKGFLATVVGSAAVMAVLVGLFVFLLRTPTPPFGW